ncbi:MAG: hypothetical protein ACKOBW_05370 [Planctomycetota bacterium]
MSATHPRLCFVADSFPRFTSGRRLLPPLLLIAMVIGVIAPTAGCGSANRPQLVPVTGRATLQGQPLTAGAIIFHPDSANSFQDDKPSSLLQVDGSFTIKTFPFGDGVPPGKYKVTLAPELASRIQRPEFGDPKTSPWNVEVPETGLRDHVFAIP